MKKLKCSSCGAPLTMEDNEEYAVCDHCGTKYKLNEDININIKLGDESNGLNKMSKILIVPVILFILVLVIIISFSFIKSKNNSNKQLDDSKNKMQETIKDKTEEAKKDVFNFQFSHDNGTKDAFFLKNTLDKIVDSNKKNDRKVTLVFNEKETADESEIVSIKQSLEGVYEVSFDYDKDGYINKIIVKKN